MGSIVDAHPVYDSGEMRVTCSTCPSPGILP